MNNNRKQSMLAIAIVVFFILCDQILKLWVKTHFALHESYAIFSWFHIYFVENPGMAFGISFGENIGKLLLTLIRVGVVGVMIYYLHRLLKKKKADWVVVGIFALIIAGALGNIIDSLFYGLIFSDGAVATLFPKGGGYAPLLYGRVVDMFYFPLFRMPEWGILGGYGGAMFFPAIFNVADICITVGIVLMLIFNKRIFPNEPKPEAVADNNEVVGVDSQIEENNE